MASLRFCLLTTFYPPCNFGGDGIDVQRTARALVNRLCPLILGGLALTFDFRSEKGWYV
jgi:hypothetical protein